MDEPGPKRPRDDGAGDAPVGDAPQLPYRTRVRPDEPVTAWTPLKLIAWPCSIMEVREEVAKLSNSDPIVAKRHPPELWRCDANGNPLPEGKVDVPTTALLGWMATMTPRSPMLELLLLRDSDGPSPRAFVLFTLSTPTPPESTTTGIKSIVVNGFPPLDPPAESSMGTWIYPLYMTEDVSALTGRTLGTCTGLRLSRTPSPTWMNARKSTGSIYWASLGDLQYVMRTVLLDICNSTGLSEYFRFHNELSLFGDASNVWVITRYERPVGVIEVNKPHHGILADKRVAGQMYDYLERLRSYYGLRNVFGITTTYAEWRVLWLPDGETDQAACESPLANLSDQSQPWQAAPWWQSSLDVPQWHRNVGSPILVESQAPLTPLSDQFVRVGPVVDYADHIGVIEMVASALFKMLQARTESVSLVSRERHYIQLTEGSWQWVKLESQFQPQPGVMPTASTKDLLLLADLRGGTEGRLWLAAAVSGAMCVLKFSKDDRMRALDHERDMWHMLWGRTDVRTQQLGGRKALVMPYVHMATEEDWAQPAVVEAARAATVRIDSLGLVYTDVRRRHLGLYKDEAGSQRAVFVDLSTVVPKNEAVAAKDEIQSLQDMWNALEL